MRAGKSITVSLADRRWLENRIDDRNVAQKYVWRAEIVLFTADGAGTNEIMDEPASPRLAFGAGRNVLGRRVRGSAPRQYSPSRIKPLNGEAAERVVDLTLGDLPGETTHWTGVLMAKASGLRVSSSTGSWRGHDSNPTGFAS